MMHFNLHPNKLSYLRIVLTVPILCLQQYGGPVGLTVCLALVMVNELSDLLDGRLARRTGQVTSFGKLLDPMADSISRVSLFIAYAVSGWMPLWMTVVIFSRDVVVQYSRIVAASQGVVLAARLSGKLKGITQGTALVLVTGLHATIAWGSAISAWLPAGWWLLFVATAVTGYSAVDYFFYTLRSIKGANMFWTGK
jgi:CDP-diacylglycerol--glycerol-3-phosphate 3-phosphatidyltransferase